MEPKWNQDLEKQRKELIWDAMKALAQKVSKKSHDPGPEKSREPGQGAPNKGNNRESGIV